VIFQLGGAVADVDEHATAYAHRVAGYHININAVWLPHQPIGDGETAWARAYCRPAAGRIEVINQTLDGGGLGLRIVDRLAEEWGAGGIGNSRVWFRLTRSADRAIDLS
jgi:hypothetical protein